MSINRRVVLKSVSLGGIAGLAMSHSTHILAGTSGTQTEIGPAVLVLVNDDVIESLFLQGAAAAGCSRLSVQGMSHDLDLLMELKHQMSIDQSLRIIGLLDDASATLVVDMARNAGARVQWLGQHNTAAGFTHHRLLTTDIAGHCARQLHDLLQTGGSGFSLHEERINAALTTRQPSALTSSGDQSSQWVASLGYLLTGMGTQASTIAPLPSAANTPVNGSFVSFSIDVRRSVNNG